MRRSITVAALVLTTAMALAGCDKTSSPPAGRLSVDGHVDLVTSTGDNASVTKDRTLRSGEQVKVEDGTAVLSLGDGRDVELRKGSTVRLTLGEAVGGGTEPRGEVVAGDVLVTSRTEAATVILGTTTVQVLGVARISRGLAAVVAVYEGAAGVESSGRSASVPALRQATVPAPGQPYKAIPLKMSASDSWDVRFLGDAMDLSNQLVSRSKGFSAQLAAGEGTTVGFYRDLLPGLQSEPFDASFLAAERSPGETLVGAAITLAGKKNPFGTRWADVFAFHDDGAPWGLVAMDQGVARGAVLALVDAAIAKRTGPSTLAAPGGATATSVPAVVPVPVPTTRPPSSTGGTAAGAGTSSGGSTPTTVAPSSTPTTPPATAAPGGSTAPATNPGGLNLGVPLVDDTVNGLIDALSGLLNTLVK